MGKTGEWPCFDKVIGSSFWIKTLKGTPPEIFSQENFQYFRNTSGRLPHQVKLFSQKASC